MSLKEWLEDKFIKFISPPTKPHSNIIFGNLAKRSRENVDRSHFRTLLIRSDQSPHSAISLKKIIVTRISFCSDLEPFPYFSL